MRPSQTGSARGVTDSLTVSCHGPVGAKDMRQMDLASAAASIQTLEGKKFMNLWLQNLLVAAIGSKCARGVTSCKHYFTSGVSLRPVNTNSVNAPQFFFNTFLRLVPEPFRPPRIRLHRCQLQPSRVLLVCPFPLFLAPRIYNASGHGYCHLNPISSSCVVL